MPRVLLVIQVYALLIWQSSILHHTVTVVLCINSKSAPCRPIARHEVEKKQSALRYVRIETALALACSFLINLFIVSVFAKVYPT